MSTLLMIVEDAFELSGLGLTLAPNVVADIEPGTYAVTAVRPDGSEEGMEVSLSWADFVPGGFKLVCRAPGVARDSLPPGTALWLP